MKSILLVAPLWAVLACGSNKSGQTVNRDTLTERQKDSILANSKIPNARAVGRAMNAADSMSARIRDRKSTRLNSSHPSISYAVFCLKKKKKKHKCTAD